MSQTFSVESQEGRSALAAGQLTRTPVSATIVCAMLGISTSELNSLYAGEVGGFRGVWVDADIRARFNLPVDGPLGLELYAAGVLTEEEGEWLDDVE